MQSNKTIEQQNRKKELKGGLKSMDFINFFNAVFNYGIAAVGLLAVIVVAVISGKKLRDRNDSKKNSVPN